MRSPWALDPKLTLSLKGRPHACFDAPSCQDKATYLPCTLKFVHLRGKAWGMGAFLPALNNFIPENWSAFSPLPGYHGAPGGAPSGTPSFFLDPHTQGWVKEVLLWFIV